MNYRQGATIRINSPFADAKLLDEINSAKIESFSQVLNYDQDENYNCDEEELLSNLGGNTFSSQLDYNGASKIDQIAQGYGFDKQTSNYFDDRKYHRDNAKAHDAEAEFHTRNLEEQFLGNLKNITNKWSQAPNDLDSSIGYLGSIIDLRSLAKNVVKGTYKGRPYRVKSHNEFRDLTQVKGIVLHQMAFNRDNDFNNYLKTGAHYIILRDGKIGQLYDHNINLNASNGFNKTTVAVEFAGNFPNSNGKWWHSEDNRRNPAKRKLQEHRPTPEQIQAGRFLLKKLISDPNLPNFKHIYAHRQSSSSRSNDPGPDIWCGVARWAISNLTYIDASHVVVGSGKPIPTEWKKCQHIQTQEPAGDESSEMTEGVTQNNRWQDRLGWGNHLHKINLLLGLKEQHAIDSNFVKAVFNWQKNSGFAARDVDGIIGPKTWKKMQNVLRVSDKHPIINTPLKKHAKRGYKGYGGGKVLSVLNKLKSQGRLSIDDKDIEMLQRMANVESNGQIQGINSYDNAYMSFGFLQWPILYNNDYGGKLQRLIARVPKLFAKYGIELDYSRKWKFKRGQSTYTSIPFKGVDNPEELRSYQWSKKFYEAGIDPDIILAEVALALQVIEENKKKIERKVDNYFLRHYENSNVLRALIQESFNHRPTWLYEALKRAVRMASSQKALDTGRFLDITRNAIKTVWRENKKPESGENMVNKTAKLL